MKQPKRSRRGSPLMLRIRTGINEAVRGMLKLNPQEVSDTLDYIDFRLHGFRPKESPPFISSVVEEEPVNA